MSGKKIVAIILAVVAVAMVGFGIYFMNSSKFIFKTALSGVFERVVDSYDEMTDELEKFNEFKKYKITTNNSISLLGNDYGTINGNMYFDADKDTTYLSIDSELMGETLIDIEGLVTRDKVYVKFKEALDKFFYTELESTEISNEGLDDDDFELLMNHLEKSILKGVGNKDLEKSSKTLNLGEKNYKTTKVSLGLSEKRIATIVENLLKSISNDKKAIQVLQKFDKSITKNTIDDLLDEFKKGNQNLSTDEFLELSFYVEGFGSLKRVELATTNLLKEQGLELQEMIIYIDSVSNKYKEKTYTFGIDVNKVNMCSFELQYISETKANLSFNVAGIIEITGTLEEQKDDVTLNLSLILKGEELGTLSYKNIVVKEDKEYQTEITADVVGIVTLTSTNTLLVGENMPNVDVSDAVHMDDMSEEDAIILDEYMEEKLDYFGLSSGDDYYEDDYWYDEEDDYYWEEEAYDTFWYEEITADEVEDLLNSEEPMVLWFGRQTCSYCADFALVLDDSYFDYNYDIYYIDVDTLTSSDIAILEALDSRLNVTVTPTTVVLQNGGIKDIHTGAMEKDEYYSFLNKNGIE